MTLTRDGVIVLTLCEQSFWKTTNYPSYETLSISTGLTIRTVAKICTSESFTRALTQRGLPPLFKTAPVGSLTPEQTLAVNLILNIYDKRSLQTKLKSLGINTSTWTAWLKDPIFSAYVTEQVNSRFNFLETDAKLALAKNIQDGDLNSIKFYLEFTGKYTPSAPNVQINLTLVVARMMEVLVKYLPPTALSDVAAELDEILASNS